MIQARCSSALAMLRRPHVATQRAKAEAGARSCAARRSRPRAGRRRSKPGSSLQATGTQRLLDWVSVPGTATVRGRRRPPERGGRRRVQWYRRVEQAASILQSASIKTGAGTPCIHGGLICLSPLVAANLYCILWWTMFSGRKRGAACRRTEDGCLPPDHPPTCLTRWQIAAQNTGCQTYF